MMVCEPKVVKRWVILETLLMRHGSQLVSDKFEFTIAQFHFGKAVK